MPDVPARDKADLDALLATLRAIDIPALVEREMAAAAVRDSEILRLLGGPGRRRRPIGLHRTR
jgi:hypothetical protein